MLPKTIAVHFCAYVCSLFTNRGPVSAQHSHPSRTKRCLLARNSILAIIAKVHVCTSSSRDCLDKELTVSMYCQDIYPGRTASSLPRTPTVGLCSEYLAALSVATRKNHERGVAGKDRFKTAFLASWRRALARFTKAFHTNLRASLSMLRCSPSSVSWNWTATASLASAILLINLGQRFRCCHSKF